MKRNTVVVVGAQWGDEGKGKVVDYLTRQVDVVARFSGGANAGHTVVADGQKVILHVLPSGIIHPNKLCFIGAGTVVDPAGILEELDACKKAGTQDAKDRLFIDYNTNVVLPYYKLLDQLREETENIGTTKRGIGPCYEAKAARRGVRFADLIGDGGLLYRLVMRASSFLQACYPEAKYKVSIPEADFVVAELLKFGKEFKDNIKDISYEVDNVITAGGKILFEGAQGALLDIDHGTYPYVTSSSCIAGGVCNGIGIGPTEIDAVIGVCKAYQTRIGTGPFPTEMDKEMAHFLREKGAEYGATTGRPRRCGWLDLPLLEKSCRLNGMSYLAITKLDILKDISPLKVCIGYNVGGKFTKQLPYNSRDFVPVYEELEGFTEDISNCKCLDDLPRNALNYINMISDYVNVPICLVSTGQDRNQTIIAEGI